MSFWKFSFASSASSTIDSLLQGLPSSSSSSVSRSSSHSRDWDLDEPTAYETTLDSLLATPDLLSEVKSGSNQKLLDFFGRPDVIQRLGGWVLWGLGGNGEEEESLLDDAGLLPDDMEDGQVNIVVRTGVTKLRGMGGVLRRRPLNERGEYEDGEDETEDEKKWTNFPKLAAELLASDTPNLATSLFPDSPEPGRSSIAGSFIVPFWETFLRSTPNQIETRGVLVGYWARVNGSLLLGPKGQQVLAHILSVPALQSRIFKLLPICSPLNDILLLLLRICPRNSPLLPAVIPEAIGLLSPRSPNGEIDHAAGEELFKGVISLGTPMPQVQAAPGPNGQQDPPEAQLDPWLANQTKLARLLADPKFVERIVRWILPASQVSAEMTPVVGHVSEGSGGADASMSSSNTELETSSLVHSLAVFIELIRRNNSDYIEQMMLSWARRREAEEGEKEMLDEEGVKEAEDEPSAPKDDKGPQLVDLGPFLQIISAQLPAFQDLIRNPRSPHGPINTQMGPLRPLTLERFRICEFYAELLHCSSMNLLNRPQEKNAEFYDANGFLVNGWKDGDKLSDHLSGITAGGGSESTNGSPNAKISPKQGFSGASTPAESLDSASGGLLTREEAKQLSELVSDSEADPFADPFADPDDGEAAEEEPPSSEESADGKAEGLGIEAGMSTVTLKEEDIPRVVTPTPAPAEAPQAPSAKLTPGDQFKSAFIESEVVETMLDLFFEFPWNNFLHNVVYDIVQQILNGRLERPFNRQLIMAVFVRGRLVQRILAGQAASEESSSKPLGVRLGYMGHMTLLSEEVVKLFGLRPDVLEQVESAIPRMEWDRYVAMTLRDTRERDLTPLAGGASGLQADTSSVVGAFSDDDDEFPTNSARSSKAGTFEGAAADTGGAGADQFSRYLRNAMNNDRSDRFGSSDEDDDDDDSAWPSGSRLDAHDADFALGDSDDRPKQLGFDDRFESVGPVVFGSSPDSDEDEGEWGAFSDAGAAKGTTKATSAALFDDEFKPTLASTSAAAPFTERKNLTPADWSQDFKDSFENDTFRDDAFPSAAGGSDDEDGDEEDDDGDSGFGDFEGASPEVGPTITLPTMESFGDFDFTESNEAQAHAQAIAAAMAPSEAGAMTLAAPAPSRPSFKRTQTADDGSAFFGGLASSEDPISPPQQPPSASPLRETPASPLALVGRGRKDSSSSSTSGPLSPSRTTTHTRSRSSSSSSGPISPSVQADLATSEEFPLGPNVTTTAHLVADGMVESVSPVDGRTIRVPADEIALAHRRSSSENERPAFI